MSSKTKAEIKAFFNTGDRPSEAQFIDFIDSYVDMSGPMGTLQAAISAGGQGFCFASGADGEIYSGTNARDFMGITVYTTAQVSALIPNPQQTLLSTKTASSSASLDFTSLITSSYDYYILVVKDLKCSSSATIALNTSANNGSVWDSDCSWQTALITPGGSTAPAFSGAASAPLVVSGASTNAVNGKIEFFNPLSSQGDALIKAMICTTTSGSVIYETTIPINGTRPVNAFQLVPSAGNFVSGSATLYGVKNT